MDQFMDDFLSGMYLEDPMTNSSKNHNMGNSSRKNRKDELAPPKTSLRRTKTDGEAGPPKRGVRRTKSTDGAALAGPIRGVRRTKSGESNKRPTRKSSKDALKMKLPPSEVLRMLETMADRGDDNMADLMMQKMKRSKDSSQDLADIPQKQTGQRRSRTRSPIPKSISIAA